MKSNGVGWILLFCLWVPLQGCAPVPTTLDPVVPVQPSPMPENLAPTEPPRYWLLNFTEPGEAANKIEDSLISFIDASTRSIHISSFAFDLPAVADALIAAKQRGVEVLWVTDDEFGRQADAEEQRLFPLMESAGVEVKDDQRTGYMHNKFWIFDGVVVWTGSTNITHNGTMLNNNNVIVFKSKALATVYEREFQEMWTGQFGITSPSTIDQQRVNIYDTEIQVLFGPEDSVISNLSYLIDNAKESVYFMAFSYTNGALGYIMRYNVDLGISTAGIFETRGASTEYSEMADFVCAGIPVRLDGNSRVMHHKVLIIDRSIVVTGSFNFSDNADTNNDENVLIIANETIAERYLDEFERLWGEGRDPVIGEDVICP